MALPNLRSIFASSRTSEEERELSRATFYKLAAFVASCLIISLLGTKNTSRDFPGKAVAGLVSGPGGKLDPRLQWKIRIWKEPGQVKNEMRLWAPPAQVIERALRRGCTLPH